MGSRKLLEKTLLYRKVAHNGGLVFAPKHLALSVGEIHKAIAKARTWGEFKSMMPLAEYSRILRQSFDDAGERRPRSSDWFSGEQIAGWTDGDYPQWLQQDMDHYLPEDVLQRYGTRKDTSINGSFWMIPPRNAKWIIRALEERGFCVEDGSRVAFH